jgi:hypothetical protein
MTTPAKAARVNSAIQVLQRTHEGMTVSDACQEAGLPRSTFYDILKKNPESLAKVRDMVDASSREQLGMILLNNTEILNRIIQDGLSNETTPRDRLTIYKTLNKLVTELADTIREDNKTTQTIPYQANWMPKLKLVKSRLSYEETGIIMEDKE